MKRWTALAMSILMLLTLIAPAASAEEPKSGDGGKDSTIAQANREVVSAYSPYDPEQFLKDCKKLTEYGGNGSAQDCLILYGRLSSGLKTISDQLSTLTVTLNEKGGDKKQTEEYLLARMVLMKCKDALLSAANSLIGTPGGEELKKTLAEEDYLVIEQYISWSEESWKLLQEEYALLERFRALCADNGSAITAQLDGNSYYYQDLLSGTVTDLSKEQTAALLEDCCKQIGQEYGELYLKLVSVRQALAKSRGYSDYIEYMAARDYSGADLQPLTSAVRKAFGESPVTFEAWDNAGQDKSADDLLSNLTLLATGTSPVTEEALSYLIKNRLHSIGDEPERAEATAFLPLFSSDKAGIIFHRKSNTASDVMSLAYALGLFASAYGEERLLFSSQPDVTACTAAEIYRALMLFQTNKVLPVTDVAVLAANEFGNMLNEVRDGCLMDEWERYVYAQKDPSLKQICDEYERLCREYGTEADRYAAVENDDAVFHPLSSIENALSAYYALETGLLAVDDYTCAMNVYETLRAAKGPGAFTKALAKAGLSPLSDENAISGTLSYALKGYKVVSMVSGVLQTLRANGFEVDLDAAEQMVSSLMEEAEPYVNDILSGLMNLPQNAGITD